MVPALLAAHEAHPNVPIGKLMEKAASISRAELNVRAGSVSNDELLFGLKALVPEWDEETSQWL